MKRWLNWIKGENYMFANKHPLAVLGRFILSIWILIIVIVGGIGFIASALNSESEVTNNECITLDTPDGSGMDTCDLLVP